MFNASSSQISVNGTLTSGINTGTQNLTNGIHLGGNYNASTDFLNGNIAEFLIINGAVSSADIQRLEGYLASKWGISLPSSHTSWQNSSKLPGAQYPGEIELGMTGLSASTSYVYRIRASNSAGSTWSNAITFTTGSQLQPPAISSADASNVAGTSATTKGNLLSFDGPRSPSSPSITTQKQMSHQRADPFLPFSLGNTLKI